MSESPLPNESLERIINSIKSRDFDAEPPQIYTLIEYALTTLQETERAVIQQIFWEQLPITDIADRMGISRQSVYNYLDRARVKLSAILEKQCSYESKWGRCQQYNTRDSLCSFHRKAESIEDFRFDNYYHQKIVSRAIVPTWDWMDDSEADALLYGRFRGDKRKLDNWAIKD